MDWYKPFLLVLSIILAVLFIGKTKHRGGNATKMLNEKD